MIGRRRLLPIAAAALTVPWLGGQLSAASGPGFHLGCVRHTLFAESDLESISKVLEAAGYEGVELRATTVSPAGQKHRVDPYPSIGQAERARVREPFEANKVRLTGLGSACQLQSADAAGRKRQEKIGKKFGDLAKDVGNTDVKVRPHDWGTESRQGELPLQRVS